MHQRRDTPPCRKSPSPKDLDSPFGQASVALVMIPPCWFAPPPNVSSYGLPCGSRSRTFPNVSILALPRCSIIKKLRLPPFSILLILKILSKNLLSAHLNAKRKINRDFYISTVPSAISGDGLAQNCPELLFERHRGMSTGRVLENKKTARGLATRGRWDFRETLLGFFERGLGGGEAGYWHAER